MQTKSTILFYLQWKGLDTANGGHASTLFFQWTPWAFLSELNEKQRAAVIRDAERSGLIFKIETL